MTSLTNGHAAHTNGHLNGHANGHENGHTNGLSNGHANGHAASTNGHVTDDAATTLVYKSKDSNFGFSTQAIHAGQDSKKWTHRALIPPIVLSTTYEQDAPGKPTLFEYSRSGNPTRECLEQALAALENGNHALVFASGLAVTSSITYLLSAGDHILISDDCYGGTGRFFRSCASKFGLDTTFVDARDVNNIRKNLQSNTKLVWIESPTNPCLRIADIAAISQVIKSFNEDIIFVVDNTFQSSYFQKPLDLGADISMHSLTKYMNGHSDVVMGAAIMKSQELKDRLAFLQNSLGAVPSAFDCFLVNRSLKTLAVRMRAHQKNGLAVAHFLEGHKLVSQVHHPGLKSHAQHELALKQSSGFSGMLSILINGTAEDATYFIKKLKIFALAESLGGVESLIELPSVMTHASVPEELRQVLGIDDSLVRISCGIEDEEDLIADLSQALNALEVHLASK